MARPVKQSVDYFPLDVHLNEKFELIEAEFGLTGFAVIIKLFQKIYGEKGYFCEWNEEVALLFAKKNNAGGNVVSEIVESAVKRGIFDSKLYKKYHILTSKGIQERYLIAVSKRAQIKVKDEFWLISHPKNEKSASENGVSSVGNPVSSVNNAQIKEKENKENKKRVNETKTNKTREKETFGRNSHVTLTHAEYESLVNKYGKDLEGIIDFLDRVMNDNGYLYENCYMQISEWAAEEYINNVKPLLEP